MALPRGIRNNNPGNLENNGIEWRGLSVYQTDPRFYQFVSPEYGIRAMVRTLHNYQGIHGLNTVIDIVSRWAPPTENDTLTYAKHVSDRLNVSPYEPVNLSDKETLAKLTDAIIRHENGMMPYSAEQIGKGIEMAGVV